MCGNNGKCIVVNNEYQCECKFGWSGRLCDTVSCDKIDLCGSKGLLINLK